MSLLDLQTSDPRKSTCGVDYRKHFICAESGAQWQGTCPACAKVLGSMPHSTKRKICLKF